MAILRAESEDEVTEVLDNHLDSAGTSEWHPIDERETNFNVVTNQAASGGKALTELCTNMVDAIILRKAHEAGIDPESPEAPQSVIAAVRDLVRLRGARSGILAEVDDPAYLRHYAEANLVIGVTGNSAPCFTFVDAGEGQKPDDFEDTFLSLSSGRKSKIPFVQGKFHMGSSGVLSYCGRRGYKLIVSKRFDGSAPWGWTLLRRRPGDGPLIAEYLKIDGQIPTFHQSTIQPLLLASAEPDTKVDASFGTIVKLYSYVLGQAANFRTIREALNENLVSTVLPFRLMDYRARPARSRGGRRALGVDERTVSGMDFQLRRLDDPEEDESDDDAEGAGDPIHVADISDPDLGLIRIQALPLPRKLPGWLSARRNRMRVYHSVNGQVQYKQGRAYISQQCRLPGLKDRVVILVDASGLTDSAHQDVWKGDRETIRRTLAGMQYDSQIADAIRKSPALRGLEEKLAHEETEQLAKQAQTDLFQNVVSADPHIAQLLPGGAIVRLPGISTTSDNGGGEYQGRYHPTYVELIGRRLRDDGVDIVVGQPRRIRFSTDAANDWLTRPDSRGRVEFLRGDGKSLGFRISHEGLLDGSLAVTFMALDGHVEVNDIVAAQIRLSDDAMAIPVFDEFRFRVVGERPNRPGGGSRQRSKEPSDQDEESVADARGHPLNRWLTHDGRRIGDEETRPWPDDFTDQDGGVVTPLSEEEKLYEINYDNAHFQHFLTRERGDVRKRVLTEQFRLSMLILMMGFEDAYSRLSDSEKEDGLEEFLDRFRALAARGAATVVMSIAQTLPQLISVETVGDPDDD